MNWQEMACRASVERRRWRRGVTAPAPGSGVVELGESKKLGFGFWVCKSVTCVPKALGALGWFGAKRKLCEVLSSVMNEVSRKKFECLRYPLYMHMR
jgi:hypothetical protein